MLGMSTPTLPSLLPPPLHSVPTPIIKNPTAVIADGIPLIPTKVLEKIRRWEYIDLATLTGEQSQNRDDPVNYGPSGNQIVIIEAMDRAPRKRKAVSDIFTWMQAYSILMAALTSDKTTTKDESVGLVAHQYIILQMAKELGPTQALKYDQEFREWAAAKDIKKWGELNFPIYGRCLASSSSSNSKPISPVPLFKGAREKRQGISPSDAPFCYKWNFEDSCNRIPCRFKHLCLQCGEGHRAKHCNRMVKPKLFH